jgi:YbbR domain-containing protein
MKDLLIKDLGWKLFSLFLALLIWLTVHRIYSESQTAPVPVAGIPVTFEKQVLIISSAADVRDFRVAPEKVTVTVSGPSAVMEVLQANQVRATVDLSDIAAAKDLARRVEVSAPAGVTLVSVHPPTVGVILPPKR